MGYTPHVLVIGGGSTGTAVARDLALRGLAVTLVERGPLTDGTTGRSHGLLHSGARYADTDPEAARACRQENRVLREIAGHCIEETGGLFVRLADDDPDYLETKLGACAECGIPVERVDGESLAAGEPALADAAVEGLRVPDAAVDPFRLTVATAKAAAEAGATIRSHTTVTDIVRDGETVETVVLRRDSPGSQGHSAADIEELEPDFVVNATGPWVDRVAELAALDVDVARSKGAMVVCRYPPLERVVNRCRPKTEGDIVVPHGEMAILGTTDEPVDDPEAFTEERRAVELLFEECTRLVPDLADARTLRSYWGVRPLVAPADGDATEPGTVSRSFRVIDHEARDGVWGLCTVLGGKFTTARLMGEAVADHVCEKFGIDRPCRTAEIPLPGSADSDVLAAAMDEFGVESPLERPGARRLGSRAAAVLDTEAPNPVVCQCETVTRAELRDAIDDATGEPLDLNEVRLRTRASMGTCQGGRCVHRLGAELHPAHPPRAVQRAVNDLLAERWKGQRHTLAGESLQEAMRTYALHATTMNRDAALHEGLHPVRYPRFDPGEARVEAQEGGDE